MAWNMNVPWKDWSRKIFYVVGSQLIFVPFYFLLNKERFGSWVGHYGQNVHLHFDFYQVVSTASKYAVKYLFFLRDFSFSLKTPVFNFFDQHTVALIVFSIAALAFFTILIFYRTISNRVRLAGFCALMFLISLIPVINLYMSTMLQSEMTGMDILPLCFSP